jgi:hypothetical protein
MGGLYPMPQSYDLLLKSRLFGRRAYLGKLYAHSTTEEKPTLKARTSGFFIKRAKSRLPLLTLLHARVLILPLNFERGSVPVYPNLSPQKIVWR